MRSNVVLQTAHLHYNSTFSVSTCKRQVAASIISQESLLGVVFVGVGGGRCSGSELVSIYSSRHVFKH